MPRYSNADLMAVDAIVIPAGSLIDTVMVFNANLLVICDTEADYVGYPSDTEEDSLWVKFAPSDEWRQRHLSFSEDHGLVKTIVDMVLLDLQAIGNGFGTVGSGLEYEIDNIGLLDALDPSEYENIAEIAKLRLAAHKSTREYFWRRSRRGGVDSEAPLDREEFEVHLVLAYQYTSEIDDYNHECDVSIEYLGEVDLGRLAFKSPNLESEK